jgi:cobaltochelatase CobT
MKKVKVTQQGTSAFVQFDTKTNAPMRVNLPYLPDDATDELLNAVQGFLDHEVAHILFTDNQRRRGSEKAKTSTTSGTSSRTR